MLRRYRADLHVHTCLSPCGDLDNSPRGVVEAARARGMDIIAVCDHNSAENAAAAQRASDRAGGRPVVLAGMEVCSAEEVHVVTLFPSVEPALDMQALVYKHLPPGVNRPEIFGEQVAANEDDEVEGFNERLLIAATNLELVAVIRAAHERGGLALPAHVDREAFGLLHQLGFIPPGFEGDGLEISPRGDPAVLRERYPQLRDWPLVRNSDAHFLCDVGVSWTEFLLEKPDLAEIALALHGKAGRRINGIS
ncbi:MAG: PHP domain-containing protein [Thermodesulfobacteriota bacterium]